MGALDDHTPGERLVRMRASRTTLIDQLTLVAARSGPDLAQAAARAMDSLRDGAGVVSVDGVEYIVTGN